MLSSPLSSRSNRAQQEGDSMSRFMWMRNLLALAAVFAASAGAQNITVYSSGNLPIGQTRQLTAYVPLQVTTVFWSVNGVTGGNSTYGTVSANGLYTAPMTIPA